MPQERITFAGSTGAELEARLDLPDSRPRAFALLAHCFTCGKDSAATARISRGLVAAGIGVLRFDFTGLGRSEGDFADTGFTSNVDDLVAAARAARAHGHAPDLLVGHSLGGAAVLAAASRIEDARAVVTIAAPFEPEHALAQFGVDDLEKIDLQGAATVTLAGREFRVGRGLLEDLRTARLDDAIVHLGRPLLVMHSPVDSVVGIESASRIFRLALHPKSFVSLGGADHLLSDREDADFAGRVIAAWSSRHVDQPQAGGTERKPDAGLPRGVVEVRGAGGAFAHLVRAGSHDLIADEPTAVGGDDHGPDPYALLLASLGACTAITLKMYASRKGWPLEDARIRLEHGREHADDCLQGECMQVIQRDIELHGAMDEAQRERLLQIADACPVHRTLTGEIRIRTHLLGAAGEEPNTVPDTSPEPHEAMQQ